MDEKLLNDVYRIYFERYPIQAVSNKELGDTQGFSAELVADTRWFKEKLIIERIKEVRIVRSNTTMIESVYQELKLWVSTFGGPKDLATIAQVLPKLDVVPALDSDLRDWAVKVANFIVNPPHSAEDAQELVFQPLTSSSRYSMTFRHAGSEEDTDNNRGVEEVEEKVECTKGKAESQVRRISGRLRRRAYRGELETLTEGMSRKAKEQGSK